MFVVVGLFAALGIAVSLAVSVYAMKVLGGGVLEALVFFGLAERPVKVPQRRIPSMAPLSLDEPLVAISDMRGTAGMA